jgi:hypothetical protein
MPFSKEYIENIEEESKSFIRMNIQLFATWLKTWSTYYRVSGTGSHGSYVFDEYGQISVYLESQDLVNNTSQIRIDHKTIVWCSSSASSSHSAEVHNYSSYRANNGSYDGTYQYKGVTTFIDGNSTERNVTVSMGSTYHTIYHSVDGTCNLHVNGSATLYLKITYPGGSNTFSDLSRGSSFNNVWLPQIPRSPSYTSISHSSVTMNSVYLSGNVDTKGLTITAGGWDISTDGGVTWAYHDGGPTGASISGLNPGTQYWYRGYVATAGGGANSGWGTFATVDNAKITVPAENAELNIENDITINFTNPSSTTINLRVETLSPTVTQVTRNGVTSPYTLTLTTEEKNAIYQSRIDTNKIPLRFVVDTINGDTTYSDWNDCKATISDLPSMAMFSVEPTDAATPTLLNWGSPIVPVTSDNGKIIQGKTILKINFGAVTYSKYATFLKFIITAGGQTYETTNSNFTLPIGLISNGNIIVEVEDSRHNKKSLTFPYTLIQYANPTLSNYTIVRLNTPNAETAHLFFNAKIAKLMKDLSQYNIAYQYKKVNDITWSGWATLSPDVIDSEGNIEIDKYLTPVFDLASPYNVMIRMRDYFNTGDDIVQPLLLNKDAPEFFIGEDVVSMFGLPPEVYEPNTAYINGDTKVTGAYIQASGNEVLDYDVVDSW